MSPIVKLRDVFSSEKKSDEALKIESRAERVESKEREREWFVAVYKNWISDEFMYFLSGPTWRKLLL